MLQLFEVYISLAACEMDDSPEFKDSITLQPALDFYEAAEEIAKLNGDVILRRDDVMSGLYFSRANCHLRRKNLQSAWVDGLKALKLRINVFGCHPKTADAFVLVGTICYSDPTIREGARTSFEFFDRAFKIVKVLAMQGSYSNPLKLTADELKYYLRSVCIPLEKSVSEYEAVLKVMTV